MRYEPFRKGEHKLFTIIVQQNLLVENVPENFPPLSRQKVNSETIEHKPNKNRKVSYLIFITVLDLKRISNCLS